MSTGTRRQSASEARNTTSKGMVLKVRPKGCVIRGSVMNMKRLKVCAPRPATIRAFGTNVAVVVALIAPLTSTVAAGLELGSQALLGFIGCFLKGVFILRVTQHLATFLGSE